MAWRLGLDVDVILGLYQKGGGGPVRAAQEIKIGDVTYTVDASDILDRVVLHTFRHTFVSIQLAAGLDLKTVAGLIGHEDPAFTLKKYAHCMPGQDEKAAAIMDEFHAARRSAVNRQ